MSDDAIDAYLRERDAALLAGTDALVDFAAKQGRELKSDIAELTLHKMRTAARSLPVEVRRASRAWLKEHGYEPLDDGDLG